MNFADDLLLVFRRPPLLFAVTFVVLWLSAWLGAFRLQTLRAQIASFREDFAVIQAATLTLLGLIIGFTFAMALSRYDLRKTYEEEEANAIGTEYVRADFLPAADATKVRQLLRNYLDQRILFYTTVDEQELEQIIAKTSDLHQQLWAAVRAPAAAHPTPVMALVVAGMNDVLNAQGYTQAAWSNRIPLAAWALMAAMAVCATALVGLGTRGQVTNRLLSLVGLAARYRHCFPSHFGHRQSTPG